MFHHKIGFRNKILFALIFFVTALFVIYAVTDFFFFDKLEKINNEIYNKYTAFLTNTIKKDNIEKEEVFLKTISNYATTLLKEPSIAIINSQMELGEFLCDFYNDKLFTEAGWNLLNQKFFVAKNNTGDNKSLNKHILGKKETGLSSSNYPDVLFFILDGLKMLKQVNNTLIKKVFLKTNDNLSIEYPVDNVFQIQHNSKFFVAPENINMNNSYFYINENDDLVAETRFCSAGGKGYNFAIGAVIDYDLLLGNISDYVWEHNIDALLLLDNTGKILLCKYNKDVLDVYKFLKKGMNFYNLDFKIGNFDEVIEGVKNTKEGFFSFTYNEKDVFAGYGTVDNLDWKFIFVSSSDDVEIILSNINAKLTKENSVYITFLEKQELSLHVFLIILMTIIFLIFIIFSLAISRKLTKSMLILHKGVEKISKGDLSYKIPLLKTGDEIEKLIIAFNGMVDSINQYIKDLAKTIKAKQEIEADIKVAADIQRSMLPQDIELDSNFNEINLQLASTLVPSKTISGDFYDFFFINNEKLFFVIGDVSGKGIPASLFMVTTKTLLKEYVLESKTDLYDIVLHLNKSIARDNYSCTFVTMFCGIIDLKSGEVEYVQAGHDQPVIYRSASNETEDISEAKSTVLGVFTKKVNFIKGKFRLNNKDVMVVFTDGITEARNEQKELWGRERLEKLVKKYSDSQPDDLINLIKKDICHFTNKPVSTDDDFTILIFKIGC